MNGKFAAYVAALIVGAFLLPVAQAKPIENYKWIEVRSENFVVRSLLSKRQTEQTVRHLELMRAVIPPSMLESRNGPSEPGVIYLLKGPSQLNELGHEGNAWRHADHETGKYFVMGVDVYAANRVLPVYAQFLVLDETYDQSAYWYSAAMFDFFSAARIRDGKFRYGSQAMAQPKNPNVIQKNVEQALSAFDPDEISTGRSRTVFAYSWLILRFLTDSHEDWLAFGPRLREYKDMVRNGDSIQDAFEKAFGYPVEGLGEAMAEFTATCCPEYVIDTRKLLPEFDPEVIKLSREEISLGLGFIAADLGARERALELFNIALGSEATREDAQKAIEALESNEDQRTEEEATTA